jgi:hypothetical protein
MKTGKNRIRVLIQAQELTGFVGGMLEAVLIAFPHR